MKLNAGQPTEHANDLVYGQQVRKRLPRSDHRHWSDKHRKRTAAQILQTALKDRVPGLLALRNQRMAASPFGYFRGAVPVMAHDLGHRPHTGILCQLCGDAHLRNLGAYAGYDGNLTFDINDFDETIRGPFEWDVKRLATSIVLAGREAGAKPRGIHDAVSIFLRRYRKSVHLFSELPISELARYPIRRRTDLQAVAEVFAKAERATPLHSLAVLTEFASGQEAPHPSRIFRTDPPLLRRLSPAEAGPVLAALRTYSHTLQPEHRHFFSGYRPLDVAFKVVGTGSVGLRDFCVYLQGNGELDPLFLQIKQEAPSAWSGYLPASARQPTQQGRRVVDGQRAMQLQSDPFLGYTVIEGRDYLVRQLCDHKAGIDIDTLVPEALCEYADLCGELFARGHSRSGSPLQIAGYLGKTPRFDKAILTFAVAYADQTERDWKALKRSLR